VRTNLRAGRAGGAAAGAGRCVIRKWLMQGCCGGRQDRLRVGVLFRQPSPDFRELYRIYPPVSIRRLSPDRNALFHHSRATDFASSSSRQCFTSKSPRLIVLEISFEEWGQAPRSIVEVKLPSELRNTNIVCRSTTSVWSAFCGKDYVTKSELSVSAVYTANPLSGDGISIDVEYIPSRRLVIGGAG